MIARPLSRAVSRRGTVRGVADGCATIDVRVPCSTCAAGACIGRRKPTSLRVEAVRLEEAGAAAGDQVSVSLAAGQLNSACLGLFGPGLFWLLSLAAASSLGILEHTGPWLGGLLAAGGLILALLIGSRLGRHAAGRLPGRIIVRRLA